MSFGPGNAFGAFAPTVARPPRRVNSAGSFKDDSKQSSTGPAPIDHPSTPSFGSWAGDQQQAQQAQQQAAAQTAEQQRSFSSILSPALPTTTQRQDLEDPLAKPFVYSREFLLSLYDDDKAARRPIELAVHEIATKEQGQEVTKPWALKEWRDGEKELFSTSIHPPASRVRSQHGQARNPVGGDSNGHNGGAFGSSPSLSHREINGRTPVESNTLDLASLGALPRERDRALVSSSSPSLSARGLGSPIIGSAEKERDLAAARRSRVGGTPLGGATGILGGVLGGIVGSGRSPLSSPTMASATRKEAPGSAGAGGKDVWQGGRWRRQGSTVDDEEPKRPTAFGARRFPTQDDLHSPISSRPGTPLGQNHSSASPAPSDGVRAAWDDDEDDSSVPASASGGQRSGIATPARNEPAPQAQQAQEQADELDLNHHASSVLGSLALDSDPVDDPLSSANKSNTTFSAPPGLPAPAAIPLVDHTWQYRDPSGQIQGPFAASMMHDWYRQTFFTPDLRVKRTQEREFETLENLIRRSGDAESPFLTAPLQAVATLPPPTTTTAQQGWPLGPSTPLDQFASPGVNGGGGSQRAFGSFYEPFGAATTTPGGGAFDTQQQQQQAQQQQFGFGGQQSMQASSQGVDPWGAPLPAASPAAWNDQSSSNANLFSGSYGQQQPQFAQHQQQQAQQPLDSPYQQHAQAQQNPVDNIFRQLAQQQQPQQQQQFYDPSQLASSNDWRTTPQMQHAQQPQQPQQQQQWSSLLPSRLDSLNLGQGSPAMSPIGPPATASAQQSPAVSFAQAQQQQQPAPISPWGAVAPVESAPIAEAKQEEKKAELPPPIAAPKEFTSIAKTTATDKLVKEAQAAAAKKKEVASKKEEQAAAPSTPAKSSSKATAPSTNTTEEIVAPAPSASPAPKSSSAPWSAPVATSSPSATPSGPSLREIQEAEAREADKRKAAARIQAAQANIQAAQRFAAQEAAEQLPASVQWASQPGEPVTAAKTTAPWSKPSKPVGKTLKEIQEEEERRKKAQAAASAQAAVASGPVQVQKGYAASAAKSVPGAPWTTVAVKPAAVATAAAAARPVIPGLNLPSSASTTRALPTKPAPSPVVRATPAPVVRAAAPAPVVVAAPAPPVVSSIIRSVAVNGRPANAGRPNGAQYDAENPPPPSEEFMKWCKDALKGLTVPMDEFIQMLLSFPLDASPDVLEIISDSVYANSSTLDGRRFANEYAARRKMDVAARYPQIAMSKTVNRVGGGKPTSMAEALKSQPVAKTPEWSVKVAGGKKKKSGK